MNTATTTTTTNAGALGTASILAEVSRAIGSVGTDITDRMDAIAETIGNDCNLDRTEDVQNMTLPVHEADLLDALRADKPNVYQAVLAAAEKVWEADPIGRKRIAIAQSLGIYQQTGGSSS